MSERELKMLIIENASEIAKKLFKGRDLELRKTSKGLQITEVTKKRVV